MSMNLITESELLEYVDSVRKKAQLTLPYALGIVSDIDFIPVNEAIMERWSKTALVDIKEGAWSIIDFLGTPLATDLINRLSQWRAEWTGEDEDNESS